MLAAVAGPGRHSAAAGAWRDSSTRRSCSRVASRPRDVYVQARAGAGGCLRLAPQAHAGAPQPRRRRSGGGVPGASRRRRKWWHGPRRRRGGSTMRSPPTRTPASKPGRARTRGCDSPLVPRDCAARDAARGSGLRRLRGGASPLRPRTAPRACLHATRRSRRHHTRLRGVESLAARLAGSGGRTRPRSNFGHLGAANHALAPIWFTLLGEAYLTAGQLAEALSSQITPPPPRRRGSSSSTPSCIGSRASSSSPAAANRRGRGALPSRDRDRSRAGGEGLRAARRGGPRPPVARPGQSRRGARPRRRDGAARRAAVVARGVVRRLLPLRSACRPWSRAAPVPEDDPVPVWSLVGAEKADAAGSPAASARTGVPSESSPASR